MDPSAPMAVAAAPKSAPCASPSPKSLKNAAYLKLLCTALHQLHDSVAQQDVRHVLRMLRRFKMLRTQANPLCLLQVSDKLLWGLTAKADGGAVKRESASMGVDGQGLVRSEEAEKNEMWACLKAAMIEEVNAFKEKEEMDIDNKDVSESSSPLPKLLGLKPSAFLLCQPEVEVFLGTLLLMFLVDNQKLNAAMSVSTALVNRLKSFNRRSLDHLGAKAWFYYYRVHELTGCADSIRPELLDGYRQATLHHDIMCRATLLNLLLRNYIHANLYEIALKLVSKTSWPENLRSAAQHARYLYYLGSIQAVRLEYSAAFAKLQLALRKAPQQPGVARGFRLAAMKKAIVVELLMGDIPERSIFNKKDVRVDLIPYRNIVQAVRSGDLHAFAAVMETHERQFVKDNTWFLIRRLHHNVIRAGLRIISLSYSRISLADIAAKLGLESAVDAESIVSKAILDGIIEATIDHNNQFVESKANVDLYTSNEPQKAFHKRISFCLSIYNDAVKAMQYPDSNDAQIKSDDAGERRKALQEEIARAEDEDVGDDLDMI